MTLRNLVLYIPVGSKDMLVFLPRKPFTKEYKNIFQYFSPLSWNGNFNIKESDFVFMQYNFYSIFLNTHPESAFTSNKVKLFNKKQIQSLKCFLLISSFNLQKYDD